MPGLKGKKTINTCMFLFYHSFLRKFLFLSFIHRVRTLNVFFVNLRTLKVVFAPGSERGICLVRHPRGVSPSGSLFFLNVVFASSLLVPKLCD